MQRIIPQSKINLKRNFSFLSIQITILEKEHKIPGALRLKLSGFTNLIAIYMDTKSYSRERLITFSRSLDYTVIPEYEFDRRLFQKFRAIHKSMSLDPFLEQELGLIAGILKALHKNHDYLIKFIDEEFYKYDTIKLNENQDLVHIIAVKAVMPAEFVE